MTLTERFGIRINGTQIWVVHRFEEFGPFDYQWSPDLRGVELTYQNQKFGEYCSSEEMFADLSEFQLPSSVYRVATVALGNYVQSLIKGLPEEEQNQSILTGLRDSGFDKYANLFPSAN